MKPLIGKKTNFYNSFYFILMGLGNLRDLEGKIRKETFIQYYIGFEKNKDEISLFQNHISIYVYI